MNKRGVQLSLNAVIGLILAIVVILFTLGFFISLYMIFFGSHIDDATMSNWENMLDEINDLQKTSKYTSTSFLLYSSPDFTISTVGCDYRRICICHKDGCTTKIFKKSRKLNSASEGTILETTPGKTHIVKLDKVYYGVVPFVVINQLT